MMQYKGYSGRVEFDDKAEFIHGEVNQEGSVHEKN
jgi:predicted HicB family RNase H-like nuclease